MAQFLAASDGETETQVPHRTLSEIAGARPNAVAYMRNALVQHHASPDAIRRTEAVRAAVARLGLGTAQERLRRFPTNSSTQKGNLAEVVLAEYVVAASGLTLPVYRLRYNPNVDQSMKGDDVLAFDLDSNPVRIVVGEAKFRGTPSAAAVTEIVEGLLRSQKGGLPASLLFVADRLFDMDQEDIGQRVLNCVELLARDSLRLDYVGLLLSNSSSAAQVDKSTPSVTVRLGMISLGVDDPEGLVTSCYQGLE